MKDNQFVNKDQISEAARQLRAKRKDRNFGFNSPDVVKKAIEKRQSNAKKRLEPRKN